MKPEDLKLLKNVQIGLEKLWRSHSEVQTHTINITGYRSPRINSE